MKSLVLFPFLFILSLRLITSSLRLENLSDNLVSKFVIITDVLFPSSCFLVLVFLSRNMMTIDNANDKSINQSIQVIDQHLIQLIQFP